MPNCLLVIAVIRLHIHHVNTFHVNCSYSYRMYLHLIQPIQINVRSSEDYQMQWIPLKLCHMFSLTNQLKTCNETKINDDLN